MGCTQSKTNEQEVTDPKVAQAEEDVKSALVEVPETVGTEAANIGVPTVKVKTPDFETRFVSGEVSINEYGVAFYNFDGSNPADPSREIHLCKRYSEFKDMHEEISKLMASEKNVRPEDQDKFQTYPALPSMPRANVVTYLLGRGNQKVVNEREAQFVKILNAIAAHPIAFQSTTFAEFMA
ncbi:uncharacterized protein PITG_13374 [Phytophthora infestans T30-4]|uniref:PX domain-containing protein n=2 Tax=Phytophthora infestans TaxID=4787 RepID=D0NLU0_PHYIT|nr:uncharacterized protein PITG_13374 [Phytophthora infestans T30-4]EEY60637.1 conserved hypothetical protein [Phytophthora infestans T30-4]KAF4033744.1 PX domain-containing protein [Phytophthora infestans]KAF4136882.1 PX domain-containing protein [Phytophthora infestans]|eukprot:XP_002900010.1 conserved hypothetical protein [Phytophthora infestans T30-4]